MKRMTFVEDFSLKSSRSNLGVFPIDLGIDRRMKWPSLVPRGRGGEQEIGIGNVDGESRGAKGRRGGLLREVGWALADERRRMKGGGGGGFNDAKK